MFYFISGTDYKKREKAKADIKKLLEKKGVDFDTLLEVPKITNENYTLLPNYFGGASLFGEKVLVNIENLLSKEDTREYIYKNLENMVESANIFLLDEPFASTPSAQKISRDLEKLGVKNATYDAREESSMRDVEPFYLCDLIEKRDKKSAWQEWKKLYSEWGDSEAMAIHGALWWKWKNIWSASIDGDRAKYFSVYRLKSRDIKYTSEELEKFAKEISLMAMRATNGEVDLMRAIENFILKI